MKVYSKYYLLRTIIARTVVRNREIFRSLPSFWSTPKHRIMQHTTNNLPENLEASVGFGVTLPL